MNRCSFCEWIPILPWPIWPLAGQLLLGQNVVVGSMTLLLAVRGKHCHEKYVGTPVFFTTALHHGLVWSYRIVIQDVIEDPLVVAIIDGGKNTEGTIIQFIGSHIARK